MPIERFYATGKRKNAIARVWLAPGSGTVTVNKRRNLQDYFARETLRIIAEQALSLTNNHGKFDIYILASGGGVSGQAGAVRHGIAKALQLYDESLRPALKKAGLLTRDSREKERKKYGQKGARARFQYSKR
ncbi:MAG: 30S ribosomal protein S9 [Deltaproteobacteria bacterium]|jgi:small subunit ribosomal protein S9|nr:30S ribosomal protein S9 [Deltaproteobacteria bacterium]